MSRAQVHYHAGAANNSVPLKLHSNTAHLKNSKFIKGVTSEHSSQHPQLMMSPQEATAHMLMLQARGGGDHETVLHDSPPPNPKIFSSQSISNNGGSGLNQRQIKKSLQPHHHHQRTFSDIPPSQALMSQHLKVLSENPVMIQTTNTMMNSNRLTMYETDNHNNHQIVSLQTYDDSKSPPTQEKQGNQHRKLVKSKGGA
jgi:hypothetical protein